MSRYVTIALLVLLLTAGSYPSSQPVLAAPTRASAAITLTVNTSEDVNNSLSTTCTSASDGKCTLRRAITEASKAAPDARPVTINFDLPTTDPNYQRDAPGTWTIVVDKGALPPLKTQSTTNKLGQVTIDGATQPDGRATGPKIFWDLNDRSFEVESTENVIRNLGFVDIGSIALKEDGNLVEDNWMGLTGDGTAVYFRTPGDEKRLALTEGVRISSDGNTVRRNTIVGAFTKAINIDGGDNNIITRNQIGTQADGTVPTVAAQSECVASFNYNPQNWYGGWGIGLSGSNNTVTLNRLAGMQNMRAENDTAPMALEIFGRDHTIQGNIIGIGTDNTRSGVCGQGIKVSGQGTNILDNLIARSRTGFESNQGDMLDGAILYSDNRFSPGGITVRSNLVFEGPGNIYVFGPEVLQALRLFRPARITSIEGTTISGGNGIDTDGNESHCPNCIIDFYLDNQDDKGDALAHIGSTVADANGKFTHTLTNPIATNQGIRTSSTTQSADIIGTLAMSTTTKFSGLYTKNASLEIQGPITGTAETNIPFTFRITPFSLATPVTYTINTTDFSQSVQTVDLTAPSLNIRWVSNGEKTITVSADNGLVVITDTHTIQIGEVDTSKKVYLPLMTK
ncbi:MAG: hypothetical protein KF753_04885 [Caldilineaceae bacterium]|nr:hypothetical protein [Caldilineaceae bacterium]